VIAQGVFADHPETGLKFGADEMEDEEAKERNGTEEDGAIG